MKRPAAVPVPPLVTAAVRLACPACGVHVPLWRRVRAGRVRCPAPACGAVIDIRGGRVQPA